MKLTALLFLALAFILPGCAVQGGAGGGMVGGGGVSMGGAGGMVGGGAPRTYPITDAMLQTPCRSELRVCTAPGY